MSEKVTIMCFIFKYLVWKHSIILYPDSVFYFSKMQHASAYSSPVNILWPFCAKFGYKNCKLKSL
jgi:hypothetical protein